MNFYSRGALEGREPLRRTLLERSLRQHFETRAENSSICVLEEVGDRDGLEMFLGLSAFEAGHSAETAVFTGIACTSEKMLGRNILVCTQPLADELCDFEARHPGVADASVYWPRDVLANYARCIFVDQADFSASVGFSPWIEMAVVQQLPMPLAPIGGLRSVARVYVFLHNAAMAAEAEAVRVALGNLTDVVLISQEAPPPEGDGFDAGAIHVHCGYTVNTPVATLAPIDSIANGAYCYLLGGCDYAGETLLLAVKQRSYAHFVATVEEAIEAIGDTLELLERFSQTGLRFNPELRRSIALNQQLFDSSYAKLDRRILQ